MFGAYIVLPTVVVGDGYVARCKIGYLNGESVVFTVCATDLSNCIDLYLADYMLVLVGSKDGMGI